MKFLSRLSIALLASIIGVTALAPAHAQEGTFPRTVTDGAGNKITIHAKPVRILSATLASDEMLLSMVDPSRLVAVTANALDTTQSNVADAARPIPNKIAKADPEAIIALNPDLVLVANYTDAGVVKQLKDAKLTVFLLGSPNSIKDIETNITLLGWAVGE